MALSILPFAIYIKVEQKLFESIIMSCVHNVINGRIINTDNVEIRYCMAVVKANDIRPME
jgi:hypothetical protein